MVMSYLLLKRWGITWKLGKLSKVDEGKVHFKDKES